MSNKVMIVSGGASGLGQAAAEKFAKNGYNIGLIDINEEKGKKVEQKIKGMGVDAIFCKCDISDNEEVQKAVWFRLLAFLIQNLRCP